MSNKAWKNEERRVAKLLRGKRVWLSTPYDVESNQFIVEVKHRATMPLAEIERGIENVAEQAEIIARKKKKPVKTTFLVVKRKAGSGIETPRIVCMSMDTFIKLHGHSWADTIKEIAVAGEEQQKLTHLPKHNVKHKLTLEDKING